MSILLFGPPGVGKGTQANLLSKTYNFVKFSMGNILRKEASLNSTMGNRIKQFVNYGILVPDYIVFSLMEKFLIRNKNGHILFDGFPRTLNQAKNLDKILNQCALSLDIALELHLDKDEIVRRLINRRHCPKCGAIYNYVTNSPKEDDLCDHCRVKLIKRSDDDEIVIRKRLQVYEEETLPLVEYYKLQNIYTRIDATGSQEEVFKKIAKIVDVNINKG